MTIDLVIPSRRKDLGGFEVGRVLPWTQRRMVGPFIFFDHMGPVNFPPQVPRKTDVRPHPHIGLSTITYLYDGEIVHRDSVGFHQTIRPGEVNWMTAGRGISHSERFDSIRETGGALHGIQAWVALPEAVEETSPSFVHFDAAQLPSHAEQGLSVKVIAGSAYGMTSPVQTHSPLFYVHLELDAGRTTDVCGGYSERAVYIAKGSVRIAGERYETGQMAVLSPGAMPSITAIEPSIVMLLGGEAIGPRNIWWNFVSSSKERIEQAKADWKAGRIQLPVDDDKEFIPLPEDPPPPKPEPMS
ncbi:pirin family protein [Peristeroidobacter soli]|uniref:pirin family protein n=1 Tax=Peristeroidobacter soli TaxID=2497877 RepID=UPI001FEA5989|nr:pirin family protein [Peristeroidobacter soli]